ncbi:MAG TPA: response regulator, partial [Gemmataceae bacterium]|nr:response regulator [Gemmataceae bacterium]
MSPPTVFVVDDDAAMRKSLTLLVQSVRLAVETYETAQQFLDGYDGSRPGCLLLDLRMPGLSGLELQNRLTARRIRIPIIFISAHGDLTSAVSAMRAGAVDFLEKPFRGQVLLDRIHQALEKDARFRAEAVSRAETDALLARLTPPERAVLDMMAAGKAYKVIARELGISYKAVEGRRARIMRKMQAENLSELLRRVLAYQ